MFSDLNGVFNEFLYFSFNIGQVDNNYYNLVLVVVAIFCVSRRFSVIS